MVEQEEKLKKIQYTQARHGILGSLAILADYEWQMQAWLSETAKHRFSDSIWYYGLDTLIESYSFHDIEEASSQLGWTVYDQEEIDALQEYCAFVLELVNETIGMDKPDISYYKHEDWPKVVEGALQLRILMAKKNIEHEFWREFDEDVNDIYIPETHQFLLQDKEFIAMDVQAYLHKHWPELYSLST